MWGGEFWQVQEEAASRRLLEAERGRGSLGHTCLSGAFAAIKGPPWVPPSRGARLGSVVVLSL